MSVTKLIPLTRRLKWMKENRTVLNFQIGFFLSTACYLSYSVLHAPTYANWPTHWKVKLWLMSQSRVTHTYTHKYTHQVTRNWNNTCRAISFNRKMESEHVFFFFVCQFILVFCMTCNGTNTHASGPEWSGIVKKESEVVWCTTKEKTKRTQNW